MTSFCVAAIFASVALAAGDDAQGNDAYLRFLSTYFSPQITLRLLQTELVQRDLALSRDQIERLATLHDAHEKAINGWMNDVYLKTPRDERDKLSPDEPSIPFRNLVREILSPEQLIRLLEILTQSCQTNLFNPLLDSTMGKELRLTSQQQQEIDGILKHKNGRTSKYSTDLGLNTPQPVSAEREALFRQLHEFIGREEERAMDEVILALTPAQRSKLEKICGRKVDLRLLRNQLDDLWFSKDVPSKTVTSSNGKPIPGTPAPLLSN